MSPAELSLKYGERVVFLLRRLYQQYGYAQYRMSKFEEYELYARNKSFLVSEHILTFTDTDGRLLALKPDVTLSIIKNSSGRGVQKVYYNENVYRTAPASLGYREIMQTGLECIGDLDECAICEVVELAARSLELIDHSYLLDLSHMGMVSGLLDEISSEYRPQLLKLIAQKNISAVQSLCAEAEVSDSRTALLCRLMELYGTPAQILPELEHMAINAQMRAALETLRGVCLALAPYHDNLRLDFSIVNDMNYYNGIIFRGYLPGLASGVLAGGQYDNLLQRMGKTGQAIGFAVYLDQLEHRGHTEQEFDVDVLLLYGKETDFRTVSEQANALREAGLSVRTEHSVPAGLRYRELKEVKERWS